MYFDAFQSLHGWPLVTASFVSAPGGREAGAGLPGSPTRAVLALRVVGWKTGVSEAKNWPLAFGQNQPQKPEPPTARRGRQKGTKAHRGNSGKGANSCNSRVFAAQFQW